MKPLFKCPNPIRELRLGRLFIASQWAKEIWCKDIAGTRETYYIKINKVQYNENTIALNIVVWKLSIYFSII